MFDMTTTVDAEALLKAKSLRQLMQTANFSIYLLSHPLIFSPIAFNIKSVSSPVGNTTPQSQRVDSPKPITFRLTYKDDSKLTGDYYL